MAVDVFLKLRSSAQPSPRFIVLNRYREESITAGIDKWLRPGVRFEAASLRYDDMQLDMGGYDENHFMESGFARSLRRRRPTRRARPLRRVEASDRDG